MQMATRTKAKTKGTYAPQPKAPPAAEKPKEPQRPAPPLNSIKIRDREGEKLNVGLAMYGMRVPELGEFGEGGFRLDEGVIPRRWASDSSAVMAVARRLAAKKEQFERHSAAREEAIEKSKVERVKRKAAMYRGMVKLDALLAEMGSAAPSAGRAKKAIERAHMIHRKFHFGPKEVEQARQVLRSLPATSQKTGASGVGPPSARAASAPDGFVTLHVKANPHKEGTEQHRRMALLMTFAGKTAKVFIEAGGCKLKLKHALSQGWITLEAGAPAPPTKTKGPARTAEAKERVPATPSKAKKANTKKVSATKRKK